MPKPPPLPRPTVEEIAGLPLFAGLPLARIHVVATVEQAERAQAQLAAARFIGFDTETKPTFTKDAPQVGPHVVQMATLDEAFIVLAGTQLAHGMLKAVIESQEIVKIGFGLASDRGPLLRKFGIQLGASVDLSHAVGRLGYGQAVGLKSAVAIVLGKRMVKSKAVTTSNWALPNLSPKQLQYAANDAYAGLAIFHAMGLGLGLGEAASTAAAAAPR